MLPWYIIKVKEQQEGIMKHNYTRSELPIRSLAQVMGTSESDVKEKLVAFLQSSGLPLDSRIFVFAMKMKQRGVESYLFVGYADVPEDTDKQKDVSIVKVPNKNFIKFEYTGNLIEAFDDSFAGDIEPYLKDHGLKFDLKSVFGLIESDGDHHTCYIPYKEK